VYTEQTVSCEQEGVTLFLKWQWKEIDSFDWRGFVFNIWIELERPILNLTLDEFNKASRDIIPPVLALKGQTYLYPKPKDESGTRYIQILIDRSIFFKEKTFARVATCFENNRLSMANSIEDIFNKNDIKNNVDIMGIYLIPQPRDQVFYEAQKMEQFQKSTVER